MFFSILGSAVLALQVYELNVIFWFAFGREFAWTGTGTRDVSLPIQAPARPFLCVTVRFQPSSLDDAFQHTLCLSKSQREHDIGPATQRQEDTKRDPQKPETGKRPFCP